jgi:phosphatidylserine/phosphatidylglycerophosphate/cardiolipin synthase-like enzyme
MKVYKSIWLLVLIIFFSCADEERYPEITEDYCSEFSRNPLPSIFDYLPSDSSGSAVYSLEEGDQSMILRAWASESATKSIDIQYFIFSADNIGLIAIDYLLRAADRGVQVRLIVDDILVEADARELIALDAHPNLSIKIYNPTANIGKSLPDKLHSLAADFRGFNQRMHNKTFVVDNQFVITGGRNIADEYFDYDHEYNFRDRDVMLTGEVVDQVQSSFELFWESTLSVPVKDLVSDEDQLDALTAFEYIHQYACNPVNFWPEVRKKIALFPSRFEQLQASGQIQQVNQVSFVSDDPGKNDGSEGLGGGGRSTDSLIALIDGAKESILIQSPYLVTTELSQSLFKAAIDRGVSIKILTNSLVSTDNLEAFSGYLRERDNLLSIGVEIYEFRPDAKVRYEVMQSALQKEMDYTPLFGLHAKSMVVDGKVAIIGTFNLDPRSANLNTECVTIIHDTTFTGKLASVMHNEFLPENSWHTTYDFNPDDEASLGKRFQLWLRGVVPKSVL